VPALPGRPPGGSTKKVKSVVSQPPQRRTTCCPFWSPPTHPEAPRPLAESLKRLARPRSSGPSALYGFQGRDYLDSAPSLAIIGRIVYPGSRLSSWKAAPISNDMILINRAPVLTLWAAVVAERLGFSPDEALSLGKAVAGLNAQAKGRALGIFEAKRETVREAKQRKRGEEFWVSLCGRPVPAKNTDNGIRAVSGDTPITSDSVARYLGQKFSDDLNSAKEAMETLAKAFKPDDLAERAYALYETFRPEIPRGRTGWGAKGALDLGLIRSLAAGK